jgi:dTDP-4-dehydrorhamnose reductase
MIVIGKSGQLARAYKSVLASKGRNARFFGRAEIDLSHPSEINKALDHALATFRASEARILINTAAYTAVDRAETEIDLANRVNSEAPTEMAKWCDKNGFRFVHYSTDYVFPGTGRRPWQETDETAPINAYGRSKLLGENGVLASSKSALIFRTAWLYDREGKNFPNTISGLLREKERIEVVDDQFGGPTYAPDLAEYSLDALFSKPGMSGIYHLGNSETVSWHGFAIAIAEKLRARGESLRCRDIIPIPSEKRPSPANRPKNSRLSLEKFIEDTGIRPRSWIDAIGDWSAF